MNKLVTTGDLKHAAGSNCFGLEPLCHWSDPDFWILPFNCWCKLWVPEPPFGLYWL